MVICLALQCTIVFFKLQADQNNQMHLDDGNLICLKLVIPLCSKGYLKLPFCICLPPLIIGWEAGDPWQVASPFKGQHRHTGQKTCTHTFILEGNVGRQVKQTLFMGHWRKPKYPVGIHTCTGRTFELYAERPQEGIWNWDLLAARQLCYQMYHCGVKRNLGTRYRSF